MRRTLACAALAALLGFGLALGPLGCIRAQRTPDVTYYTLEVPGASPGSLPGPPRVGAFTADEPYASSRLAYRSSPFRLQYYLFHRWAGSPQSVVAGAVRDYLARAPHAEDGLPVHVEGHIRKLEEVDGPDGWRGFVALDLHVRRGATTQLERSYEESEPAAAESPEAVVEAISRALGRILDRLVADLASGTGTPDGTSGE